MTALIADIRPWTGYIVPGEIDPHFRAGMVVNPSFHRIHHVEPPTTEVKADEKLGDGHHLIKQLVNVLQTSMQSKITEAIPQYRRD